MPGTRAKKPVHLEVTGLAPPRPQWRSGERALIEPVLARACEAPKLGTAEPQEVRDGEAN